MCTQTLCTYRYIHRHRVHTGIYTDTAYIQVYTQCLTSFAVIENPQQLMVPLCSGRLVVVKEQGRMRIGGCPLSDLYQYSSAVTLRSKSYPAMPQLLVSHYTISLFCSDSVMVPEEQLVVSIQEIHDSLVEMKELIPIWSHRSRDRLMAYLLAC